MKKFSDLCRLIAASILFTSAVAFAPQAAAISTYDAAASFSLTLTDVTDSSSTTVTSGWDVTAFGDGFFLPTVGGAATADASISVVDPAVSLSILDSITQSSSSSGSATNGFSLTDALTNLDIAVDNFSGQALTFSFDFSAMADATTTTTTTTDNAAANATVVMLDDLGYVVDIQACAEALSGGIGACTSNATINGSFDFALLDGEFNLISGFVDSYGSADAVPVPAAVWLFGSGLLGLIGIARRKKA